MKISFFKFKGEDTESPDRILVNFAGDITSIEVGDHGKPILPEDDCATLECLWVPPEAADEAADILFGPWLRMGFVRIEVSLEELESKGGIFTEAAAFIRASHAEEDQKRWTAQREQGIKPRTGNTLKGRGGITPGETQATIHASKRGAR